MNNLRFATIIHILVLAYKSKLNAKTFSDEMVITSDFIAGSINVNPVVVRREIKFLKEAGILESKKGKDGGCYLVKEANEISFGDLFQLINNEGKFGKLNHPNPKCPVGNKMNGELKNLYQSVENEIINSLNHTTLKEFADRF